MTSGVGANLFVGVTTWNSEWLLPACLDSLRRTVPAARVLILDNESEDGTLAVAGRYAVPTMVQRCSQGDALNALVRASDRPLTLLIHSDVVLLASDWLAVSRSILERDGSVLVSPEDVGCGPFTRRGHGQGMPESSFLLFLTKYLPLLRTRQWYRQWRIPCYRRQVDFFGDHVTYNLPLRLSEAGLRWSPMKVFASGRAEAAIYTPPFAPVHWSQDLAHLRYGLGNFYGLSGVTTHYHNWYDRKGKNVDPESKETAEPGGLGVPLAYIRAYTERFLSDYWAGCVKLPDVAWDGYA